MSRAGAAEGTATSGAGSSDPVGGTPPPGPPFPAMRWRISAMKARRASGRHGSSGTSAKPSSTDAPFGLSATLIASSPGPRRSNAASHDVWNVASNIRNAPSPIKVPLNAAIARCREGLTLSSENKMTATVRPTITPTQTSHDVSKFSFMMTNRM